MNTLKTTFGLLAVALAAVMTQAAEPTISCETDGNNLLVTYTGTLYQSEDAVHWTEVASASSPYQVKMGNKKLFFCSKGESENKNFTIPLSDTVDLDMIWIEPGTFIMGSPEDELGRYDDEVQHEVTLTRGYWLGKYAVTQAQYEVVMESNPSWYKGADLPVEQVTWDEAKEFCEKLTAIEKAAGRLPQGYEYSLPTEAQWEYACRAGTTTALNSGKNLTSATECPNVDEVAWYKYNSDKVTHPIGQKETNAWGLYDMHGDIWEWCLDCYGDYPASSVTDPVLSSGDESIRIIRGGSWYYDAKYCRSAYRGSNYPSSADRDGGFRVALAPVK